MKNVPKFGYPRDVQDTTFKLLHTDIKGKLQTHLCYTICITSSNKTTHWINLANYIFECQNLNYRKHSDDLIGHEFCSLYDSLHIFPRAFYLLYFRNTDQKLYSVSVLMAVLPIDVEYSWIKKFSKRDVKLHLPLLYVNS